MNKVHSSSCVLSLCRGRQYHSSPRRTLWVKPAILPCYLEGGDDFQKDIMAQGAEASQSDNIEVKKARPIHSIIL